MSLCLEQRVWNQQVVASWAPSAHREFNHTLSLPVQQPPRYLHGSCCSSGTLVISQWEKKGSLWSPGGPRCQGHLSSAVFHSVYWTPVSTLPDYIKHWMHECPTAGRLRRQQPWWAVEPPPDPRPRLTPPAGCSSASLFLSTSLSPSLSFCTSEDRVLVRTALHARLNLASSYSGQSARTLLWVTKRSALIKISICCHREW